MTAPVTPRPDASHDEQAVQRPVVTFDRARRAGARTLEPPPGALVRFDAGVPGWAAALPPAPTGGVTVSFSSPSAAARGAAEIERLGYRPVGVAPAALSATSVADFLVAQDLIEQHVTWWRALTGGAAQVFGLSFGPVVAALSDVITAHLEPPRPRPSSPRR